MRSKSGTKSGTKSTDWKIRKKDRNNFYEPVGGYEVTFWDYASKIFFYNLTLCVSVSTSVNNWPERFVV